MYMHVYVYIIIYQIKIQILQYEGSKIEKLERFIKIISCCLFAEIRFVMFLYI